MSKPTDDQIGEGLGALAAVREWSAGACDKSGRESLLDDSAATPIDTDCDLHGDRILYELRDPLGVIKLIKLENSTHRAEEPPTYYTVRVPPETKTCRQAVAFMYSMKNDMYAPVAES